MAAHNRSKSRHDAPRASSEFTKTNVIPFPSGRVRRLSPSCSKELKDLCAFLVACKGEHKAHRVLDDMLVQLYGGGILAKVYEMKDR